MEMKNPLRQIVNITQKSKWYKVSDFSVMVAFQFLSIGITFSNSRELAAVMVELAKAGFIEIDQTDDSLVRPMEYFYDA